MKILCLLGFHKWHYKMKYSPNFNAVFINRIKETRICLRCQIKEKTMDYSYSKLGSITNNLTGETI